MVKTKTKLATLLVALTFVFACLGIGSFAINNKSIDAKASGTYTVTSIGTANGTTDSVLYVYSTGGDGLPKDQGDWDNVYNVTAGSFTFNGEEFTPQEIKMPGDLYVVLGKTATNGDILVINATLYNANTDVTLVFQNCGLRYNGSSWVTYTPPVNPTTYNIGALELHVNSSVGGASGANNFLYLQRKDGEALPILNWAYSFEVENKNNFTKNGEAVTLSDCKSTGDGFYFSFDALDAGDCITVKGNYFCESQNVRYVITESKFIWNGSGWEVGVVTHNIGALELHVNSSVGVASGLNSALYLQRADGEPLPFKAWGNPFTYESGTGLKINGSEAALSEMQSTGDGLFISFGEVSANSTVTIGGTFYCDNQKIKYVIEDSSFLWNGTGWKACVNYTVYEIGKVAIGGGSSASAVYFDKASGAAFEVTEGTWTEKLTFEAGSGIGVTLDGNQIAMDDIKIPNNIYCNLGATATEGQVLAIGGTFYNENLAVKYVIEESKFEWNGSAWVEYEEPSVTKYEITCTLTATGSSDASAIYAYPTDESQKPAFTDGAWAYNFTFVEGTGNGKTINGEQVGGDLKKPGGDFYITFGGTAEEGDVFGIDGEFHNADANVSFIFHDCKLEWNGSGWEKYVDYKTYNVGSLVLENTYNNATQVSFVKSNGSKFEVVEDTWTEKLTFLAGSGVGVTINDTQIAMDDIKIPGYLYVGLGTTAKTGDGLAIGGTFYNANLAVKNDVEESKFEWNGSAWVEYVSYATYEIGQVKIGGGSSANAVYFDKVSGAAFEVTDGTWTEKLTFLADSGVGVTVNGTQISMNDIKIPNNLFVGLGTTGKKDDVLVVEGTFYNANLAVKYVIERSEFIFTGTSWVTYYEPYSDDVLAVYDLVTPIDLGLGDSISINGVYDGAGLSYVSSPANTTGSVKFRFGYMSSNVGSGGIAIRLRGAAWEGIHFRVIWGKVGPANKEVTAFENDKEYVVEVGAIDFKDGSGTWVYASVDGYLVYSEKQALSTWNTTHLSIYGDEGTVATISDDARVTLTYVTSSGSLVDYAEKNGTHVLANGKTHNTFIGWIINGELYQAGDEISVGNANVTATALELDFVMEEGAAIRIASTEGSSGIRFTTKISTAGLTDLAAYGATVTYGTIIIPLDYLNSETSQEPNLEDSFKNKLVLASTYSEVDGNYTVYRGAMANVNDYNYSRLFAGRGYMTVTFANGETMTVYTPFNYEDNVRSVRYVAEQYMSDGESDYSDLDAVRQGIINGYASAQIKLIDYSEYVKDSFNVTAWYHPALDESNNYYNDANIAAAQKLIDAGIKTVILDGQNHIDLNNPENVVKTRKIIEFFWSQGLQTIAFGSNASTNFSINFAEKGYPDFSDCEGFIGFLVWDEPKNNEIASLASLAAAFETAYAGTGVTFMANLLPSYAADFNGTSNWWESSVSSLKVEDYQDYLKEYCETVLSQISGEKWLSMDSYPINADYTLTANFLFDLAMTKYYALEYNATSHAVLQSSGWTEDDNETKYRMPTAEEMRMQAYAAMAFGIDSISWWSYANKRDDGQYNPTDNDEYYSYFKEVNTELSAISSVYSAFNWKGVILGTGKNNGNVFTGKKDNDYEAYNLVNGKIGAYELSASSTKYLSSVATNKTNWNYLMGVMEDVVGNEAYVLCNYNSHEEDRTQTITITFGTNVTEVMIYRGGVMERQTVINNSLAVELATGEGVIIIPSAIA